MKKLSALFILAFLFFSWTLLVASVQDDLWQDNGDGSISPRSGKSVTIGTMNDIVYVNPGDIPVESSTGGIQEAIDRLPAAGGTVILRNGNYSTKAAIKLRNGVHLRGETRSGVSIIPVDAAPITLAADAASGQPQIVVADATNLSVGMDVLVYDDTTDLIADWDVYPIAIDSISGVTITLHSNLPYSVTTGQNAKIINIFSPILADGHKDSVTLTDISVSDLTVISNGLNTPYISWMIQAGISFAQVSRARINNCRVYKSPYDGIMWGGFNTASDVIISNCIAEANLRYGIHVGGGAVNITSNRTIDNGQAGIYLCKDAVGCRITNNYAIFNDHYGILIGDVSDWGNIIANNTVYYNDEHGIFDANGTSYNQCFGNTIYNNGQDAAGTYDGIRLNNSQYWSIFGNTIANFYPPYTQGYGISETGTANHNSIGPNVLRHNVHNSTLLSGVSTIVTGAIQPIGPNLVQNGGGESGTTSWTAGNNAALSIVAGGNDGNALKIARDGTNSPFAYQAITVTSGKLYRVAAYGKHGDSGVGISISVGNSPVASDYWTVTGQTPVAWTEYGAVFKATADTIYITLLAQANAGTQYDLFDMISCYEVTPGYIGTSFVQ
ncbi:MAG: right-handed parallel beta-helix repeat-containing protein [Sphaerochaeta sp.]|jgi:parallel beta-helix repeat protein|nr:right-handed parallel beta-helix repeat-containing protein [Sphaerochaeta sp.]